MHHKMKTITSNNSIVWSRPANSLYYSFECKSLARAQRDHDNITNKIYFADFCDFTVTTTRRKSLPFATSVDWESLGKFDGEDVLQEMFRTVLNCPSQVTNSLVHSGFYDFTLS